MFAASTPAPGSSVARSCCGPAGCGLRKGKPNFTLQEMGIVGSEELKKEQLLFGVASTHVNAGEKRKIWWRLTSDSNAAGLD